jgi:uncharacterized protein YbjT (DUF2867 family)
VILLHPIGESVVNRDGDKPPEETDMIAITGISGQISSQLAQILLNNHKPVRAVVRDPNKAQSWAERGCEIAQADIYDAASLTAAFMGAEAVFVLAPPVFDPGFGFPEAHAIAANLSEALLAARPAHVVYLSMIGAQAAEENLLTQHTIIETALRRLPVNITFLRPGWFMENTSWDVAPARETGIIPSFLQPLDKPVPMVATADIAEVAARLLMEAPAAQEPLYRTVELEGPERVTPSAIAAVFTKLLGRTVTMQVVPRETWRGIFEAQGMKNPGPRIRMLDGFNEGWITFEGNASQVLKGKTFVEQVIGGLLAR